MAKGRWEFDTLQGPGGTEPFLRLWQSRSSHFDHANHQKSLPRLWATFFGFEHRILKQIVTHRYRNIRRYTVVFEHRKEFGCVNVFFFQRFNLFRRIRDFSNFALKNRSPIRSSLSVGATTTVSPGNTNISNDSERSSLTSRLCWTAKVEPSTPIRDSF